jgi:hypothetical protein
MARLLQLAGAVAMLAFLSVLAWYAYSVPYAAEVADAVQPDAGFRLHCWRSIAPQHWRCLKEKR